MSEQTQDIILWIARIIFAIVTIGGLWAVVLAGRRADRENKKAS